MNRKGFFSEMNKGFLETIKAISEPFLEEKLIQLDRATDELLQIEWFEVTEDLDSIRDSQSKLISGRNIIFTRVDNELIAVDGTCPTCRHLLMLDWQKEIKCYLCDQKVNLKTKEGSFQVTVYPLRNENLGYEIGLPKR